MKFEFSNLKQNNSLPYMKTKFFATLFTTLITAAINISRDSKGFIYTFFREVYNSIPFLNENSNFLVISIKNIVSTFTRCVDVALNVIIIFIIIYTVISIIQQKIYSKLFKKRREFLKTVLWEAIIPNLLEVSQLEEEFIFWKNTANSSNGCVDSVNESSWCMKLSASLEIHRDMLSMIEHEGIFESISDKKRTSKSYTKYLKEINFHAVYTLFIEEEKVLSTICDVIKSLSITDDSYKLLYEQYTQILNKHHAMITRMNTNKQLIDI